MKLKDYYMHNGLSIYQRPRFLPRRVFRVWQA